MLPVLRLLPALLPRVPLMLRSCTAAEPSLAPCAADWMVTRKLFELVALLLLLLC